MNNKNCYRDDFLAIISCKLFCCCVLLTVVLSFGFATFNMAVSTDDLQGYIYTGSGQNMLASGRFTIYLIDHLTSTTVKGPVVAYINDILAILGLVWSAVNFCIFFRRVCGNTLSNAACTVFVCIFVSYPLITELWEYIGAFRIVAFGYLCDSFVLLLMYDVIHTKEPKNWIKIFFACFLMMLVCAGYESLIPVYIFCVFTILALQVVHGSKKEKHLSEIIRQGLVYAAVLVVGLLLRVIVHRIILEIMNLSPATNGKTEIYWGTASFRSLLIDVILGLFHNYIMRAIVYFPLTELLLAAIILGIIGIFLAIRHGWSILLPGFGMFFSLIILSLIQGCVTGYRSCQVFAIFVAFAAAFLVMLSEQTKKRWIKVVILFFCGYLCFHQANQTNYFLTLNYMRTEHEANIVDKIGTDLYSGFDTEKPVIFVGHYILSDNIIEAASISENSNRWKIYQQIHERVDAVLEPTSHRLAPPSRKLPETNVNSVIDFCIGAFKGNQEAMQRLFSFYGFDYVLADCRKLQKEASTYVQENHIPSYPKNGYIQDVGEYIIIHIR